MRFLGGSVDVPDEAIRDELLGSMPASPDDSDVPEEDGDVPEDAAAEDAPEDDDEEASLDSVDPGPAVGPPHARVHSAHANEAVTITTVWRGRASGVDADMRGSWSLEARRTPVGARATRTAPTLSKRAPNFSGAGVVL